YYTAEPCPLCRRLVPPRGRKETEDETEWTPGSSQTLAIILSKRRESTIESHGMKSNILVLLAAVAAHAAEFSTGQAARLVIGQKTFTDANQGADRNLVGGVGGVAYAGNMLFVVDSNRI